MTLKTRAQYIESLRQMKKRIFLFGEEIENPVDHPLIRPSLNALAMTYELSQHPLGNISGRHAVGECL
jgi:4-hydroxybutyryl-CoA dehydratase/vinylacetyl-CoA-Delta-isomerase